MITSEEIKKVEKLQKIERKIKMLEQDYRNAKHHSLCYRTSFDFDFDYFNKDYSKELARIIKHRILKLKRKRKELLEGK